MRKMINKQIGVSCLIALTLVVIVSLFTSTNIYADSYKYKDKEEGKGLRIIIDLVKEDIRDHVLYDRYEGEYYYKDVYDPNLVVVKVTVGKGTCWGDTETWGYRGISKIYELYYDKTIEYVFGKDAVKIGQPFYVYIENLENEHNVCYYGYNHKGKHPEYVTAFLPI
jgi:hypothetical protein